MSPLSVALTVIGAVVLWARRKKVPSDRYGVELANAVADRLETGCQLSYAHREYCGVGLRFVDREYIYGEVWDAHLPASHELDGESASMQERLVFASRQAFVDWLAAQDDRSLDGENLEAEWLRGNQRIARDRLESFARGEPVPPQ